MHAVTAESEAHAAIRALMKNNFVGLPEASQVSQGITKKQEAALEVIPYSAEELQACGNDYVLFADLGASIMDFRRLMPPRSFLDVGDCWYSTEDFALCTVPARWVLLRKKEAPGTNKKSWEQQLLLLPPADVVPSTRQVVCGAMLMFSARGQRLFREYVRTHDTSSRRRRVHVGGFGEAGLGIYDMEEGLSGPLIGLGAARKLPA